LPSPIKTPKPKVRREVVETLADSDDGDSSSDDEDDDEDPKEEQKEEDVEAKQRWEKLQTDFLEYSNWRLLPGGKCLENDLVDSFRQHYSDKYKEKQQLLSTSEISKVFQDWYNRKIRLSPDEDGAYQGFHLNPKFLNQDSQNKTNEQILKPEEKQDFKNKDGGDVVADDEKDVVADDEKKKKDKKKHKKDKKKDDKKDSKKKDKKKEGIEKKDDKKDKKKKKEKKDGGDKKKEEKKEKKKKKDDKKKKSSKKKAEE
jgi:hypothetical protein